MGRVKRPARDRQEGPIHLLVVNLIRLNQAVPLSDETRSWGSGRRVVVAASRLPRHEGCGPAALRLRALPCILSD